jgi:hypothetical protein
MIIFDAVGSCLAKHWLRKCTGLFDIWRYFIMVNGDKVS